MQCISTRDWPQGARDFLRRLNSRPAIELVGMRELADGFGDGRKCGRPRKVKRSKAKAKAATNANANTNAGTSVAAQSRKVGA